MKRFLSILLSVLMVMSTMSVVALAEDALKFELTFDMLEGGVVKAGAKVQFDVEAADGADVTYYNNGVAVTPTIVKADDAETEGLKQTVALPVSAGVNKFTAKVGDTESAAITVNSYAYNNETTIIDEAELLSDTNATTFETIDAAGRTDILKLTRGGRATGNQNTATVEGGTVEVSFDAYFNEFPSSYTALLGPYYYINTNVDEGLAGVNIENGMNMCMIVYPEGVVEWTNFNGYASGELNTPFTFETNKWYNISYYIDTNTQKFSYYIDGVLYAADIDFKEFIHRWNKDGDSTTGTASNGTVDGKEETTTITTDSQTFTKVNTVWATMWNNNADAFYIDNFAMNAQSVAVPSIAIDETLSGDVTAGTKIPVTVNNLLNGQKVVANINGVNSELTAENGAYNITVPAGPSTIYVAILNADGTAASNLYTGAAVKTGTVTLNDSRITMSTSASSETIAGTKIPVTAENVASDNKVIAYINGVATTLGTTDGTYYITVPAGYANIYAAITTADGAIATDSKGNALKTNEVSYYGVATSGDATIMHSMTFEEDLYPEGEKYAGSRQFVGFNDTTWSGYNNQSTKKAYREMTEGNNNYLQIRRWSATANLACPDDAYVDGAPIAGDYNIVITSSAGNLTGVVDTSVKYRLDGAVKVDADTGDVTYTYDTSDAEDVKKLLKSTDGAVKFLEILVLKPRTTSLTYKSCTIFAVDSSTGKLKVNWNFETSHNPSDTSKYVITAKESKILDDVDLSQWNDYRVVADTVANKMWAYVNGVEVASGTLYNYKPLTGDAESVTSIYYPEIGTATIYNGAKSLTTISYDDVICKTYASAEAAPTGAFINATANGIGIIPANLAEADKVGDMAIVARAADGSVQVQTYNALTTTDTYKYFTFKNAAEKIFIWNWENLKPIVEAITPAQ